MRSPDLPCAPRIEPHESAGETRVPAMVERVVFLGAVTQVLLRLAPSVPLQALVQNDGEHQELAQGAPVYAYLPPDRLRVLAGARGAVPAPPPASHWPPATASAPGRVESHRAMRYARSGGMISNESRRKADT